MRLSWKAIVTGTAGSMGALVLGATMLASSVNAQAPSPPARFFGTATLNGQAAPNGAAVVASVGSTVCGRGSVVSSGGQSTYSVDVASANTQAGCGTMGARVSFTVNGVAATQTGEWSQGAFISLNLTAAAATATATAAPATATPTRAATVAPATPTRAATVAPATPTRAATAAPTARPTTVVTPPAQRPAGPAAGPAAQRPAAAAAAPAAQRPAAAPAAAAPAAARPAATGGGAAAPAAAPAALPRTGTGLAGDNTMTTGYALGALALVVVALGATGMAAYRRSR